MITIERYDYANLIFMFDDLFCKVIKHLEAGSPEKALLKAKEIHEVIEKLKNHIVGDVYDKVVSKI